MKLSQLIELLREYELGDRSMMAARPDDSGIRGKGANKKNIRRMPNFPYDRDVTYGQPAPYDRGSSGGATLNHMLIPKDDTNFSLTLIKNKGKEDMDEILGSPILLSKGGSSQMGSTVPGVSGWAGDPPRSWDENDMEESPLNIDTRPSDVEVIPFSAAPDNFNLVNPELFAVPDSHLISPDPWSVINSRLSSRGLFGLMPSESAWDRVSGMTNKKREIS